MKFIIQFFRIIVGALFLFSGAIKANDPMGTSYKLQEYFTVFHMGFLNGITDYLSIAFCGLEIALGFALLVGAFSRITTLALTGLIIFFTWLTGYSAMTGKVTDCGCFGDFIHLEPTTSFYKDIVLLVLSIVLLLGRDTIKPLFAGKWNNFVLVLLVGASFFLPIWAFMHLPVIDMLAYKPGNNIKEKMTLPPNAKQTIVKTVFVCKNKKTGAVEEMASEDYVKKYQDYDYMDRKDKVMQQGDKPEIHDFVIFDDNNRQVQDSLLSIPTYCFWVVVYDVTDANKSCFTKINALVKNCDAQHIPVIGLTHSDYKTAEPFRHDVQAAFPFYYAGDDKFVKTMMRSSPGIMLMKNGIVIKKWHYNDVPTYDEAIR
ncbi:MAG: hypothetical protein RL708_2450 [Bacteroidota bacterium]|jgi:uncharacterized membrane protein YphA (DoxX/SURF4 family)